MNSQGNMNLTVMNVSQVCEQHDTAADDADGRWFYVADLQDLYEAALTTGLLEHLAGPKPGLKVDLYYVNYSLPSFDSTSEHTWNIVSFIDLNF